ncbi:hypothetical protein M9458_015735, partial [Cirrhinus mrigala]
ASLRFLLLPAVLDLEDQLTAQELHLEEEFERNLQTSRIHLNALAVHRMSLAMEEFPQMVGLSRNQDCDRARSVLQRKRQFSCDKIAEEVDEEGPFTVEEDKARRTFLR